MTDTTNAETAVREALAKMTPGDYAIDPLMGECSIVAGRRLVANTGGFQSSVEITAPQNAANAAGIVALRNHTPALLAELDAARAEVARLTWCQKQAANARRKLIRVAADGEAMALVMEAIAALDKAISPAPPWSPGNDPG